MSEEKVLSRRDFLDLPEPSVTKVYVEGLKANVHMKQLSATDQDSYDWELVKFEDQEDGSVKASTKKMDMRAMKANTVRAYVTARKPSFNDEEYEIIGRKFPHTVSELHNKALEVNEATNKARRNLRKNSEVE